jgi:hypothetical protein
LEEFFTYSNHILSFKLYTNRAIYKAFNTAFKDKFFQELPNMGINHIVPIMRVQYRGPALKNPVIIECFMNYMKSHRKYFENLATTTSEKLLLAPLYLEGTIMINDTLPELTEFISAQLLTAYD